MNTKSWIQRALLTLLPLSLIFAFSQLPAQAATSDSTTPGVTPIVLFPGFPATKLLVTVKDQKVAPNCPRSGTFQDWFMNDTPTAFSQVCRDKLMTLRYNSNPSLPMPARFSEQQGVTVSIIDYGKTESAPYYEDMYRYLEAHGYVRDKSIKVAGYDHRLTPDMGGFLDRTRKLIEDTYRENHNHPVHLVGHSNGPLYAQYLLTHSTAAWKKKYIQGFTPIAGNFGGQGLSYTINFTGLNIQDFSNPVTKENAESSARMYLTAPTSYMGSADPAIFGDHEVVVHDDSRGRDYTPRDFLRLYDDAKLPDAKEIAAYYTGFVKFADKDSFPGVDVNAEKGSGVPTVVGANLHDLSVGQVANDITFLTRDGDGNQEDITNDAIRAWSAMPCYHFSLTDNPGVDHFTLPLNSAVLDRLVTAAAQPRSQCS